MTKFLHFDGMNDYFHKAGFLPKCLRNIFDFEVCYCFCLPSFTSMKLLITSKFILCYQ